MTTYKNYFATRNTGMQPYFATDAKPIKYKGYLLYNRLPGVVCDIVKRGTCIGQVVTVRAAKARIDKEGSWKLFPLPY